MTTYDDIYDAFVRYAATRTDLDWWILWGMCQHRMEALVKTRAVKLKNPLSTEDIDSLVLDSTICVAKKLIVAPAIEREKISAIFWFANRRTWTDFNRHKKKWKRIQFNNNL